MDLDQEEPLSCVISLAGRLRTQMWTLCLNVAKSEGCLNLLNRQKVATAYRLQSGLQFVSHALPRCFQTTVRGLNRCREASFLANSAKPLRDDMALAWLVA